MRIIFSTLLMALLLFSCKSDDDSNKLQSIGQITNLDLRTCACHCGDYFVQIDGTDYLFQLSFLPENNIDFSEIVLPMTVRLEWENEDPNPNCPVENRISIYSIAEYP